MNKKLLYIDCYNGNDRIDEFILFDLNEEKIYDFFEEQSIHKNNPIKENPICKIQNEEMYEDYLTFYNENEALIITDQQFKTFLNFNHTYIYNHLKYSSFFIDYSLVEWLI